MWDLKIEGILSRQGGVKYFLYKRSFSTPIDSIFRFQVSGFRFQGLRVRGSEVLGSGFWVRVSGVRKAHGCWLTLLLKTEH